MRPFQEDDEHATVSRVEQMMALAHRSPNVANAIATIMVWRLLRSMAAILATIMLALVVIAIHVL